MIAIVGGTYREVCLEPYHNDIFGSGLRATKLLLENTCEEIKFYTAGNHMVKCHLKNYSDIYNNLSTKIFDSKTLISFKYNFFLDNPNIYHNNNPSHTKARNLIKEDKVICFGMLDANLKIKADKVVYDPQTSINPNPFKKGSIANKLIYIVNLNEAKILSKQSKIREMLNYFFDHEGVFALIIKNGPFGAKLYKNKETVYDIPVFKTHNVFKIGSGDIFTTTFAYHWLKEENCDLKDCVKKASFTTALYCDLGVYNNLFNYNRIETKFTSLQLNKNDLKTKKVYLAGPIFTLPDLMLIDKIRDCFLNLNLKVFSPYHDVGIGDNEKIAKQDLKGIDTSDIIFAVLDGIDSGTMIELGYAMAQGKKIIGYNRNENASSFLMLGSSRMKNYKDLTTAIYQTIWDL